MCMCMYNYVCIVNVCICVYMCGMHIYAHVYVLHICVCVYMCLWYVHVEYICVVRMCVQHVPFLVVLSCGSHGVQALKGPGRSHAR